MRKTKHGRAFSPGLIPIEIRKCFSEEGVKWLTKLFNVIFRTTKMPNGWRTNIIVLLYKITREIFKIVIIIKVLNYLLIR